MAQICASRAEKARVSAVRGSSVKIKGRDTVASKKVVEGFKMVPLFYFLYAIIACGISIALSEAYSKPGSLNAEKPWLIPVIGTPRTNTGQYRPTRTNTDHRRPSPMITDHHRRISLGQRFPPPSQPLSVALVPDLWLPFDSSVGCHVAQYPEALRCEPHRMLSWRPLAPRPASGGEFLLRPSPLQKKNYSYAF